MAKDTFPKKEENIVQDNVVNKPVSIMDDPLFNEIVSTYDQRVSGLEQNLNSIVQNADGAVRETVKSEVADLIDLVRPLQKDRPVNATTVLGDTLKLLGSMTGIPAFAIGLSGIGDKLIENDPDTQQYRKDRDLANVIMSSYPQLTSAAIEGVKNDLQAKLSAGQSIFEGRSDLFNAIAKAAIDAKSQIDIEKNRNIMQENIQNLIISGQKDIQQLIIDAETRRSEKGIAAEKELTQTKIQGEKELAQLKGDIEAKIRAGDLDKEAAKEISGNYADVLVQEAVNRLIDEEEIDDDPTGEKIAAEKYKEWINAMGKNADPNITLDTFKALIRSKILRQTNNTIKQTNSDYFNEATKRINIPNYGGFNKLKDKDKE